jgi:hypothetical protein
MMPDVQLGKRSGCLDWLRIFHWGVFFYHDETADFTSYLFDSKVECFTGILTPADVAGVQHWVQPPVKCEGILFVFP